MPVYEEKIKDIKTGKMKVKLIDGKKQYYIRTYITDEFGNRKQVTRHNKDWLGLDGKNKAQQEENIIKNHIINSNENIILSKIINEFLEYKKTTIETTTYNLYLQIINIYIKPNIDTSKKVRLFLNNDIISFKEKLNKLNISLSLKRNIYVITKLIFDYASLKVSFNNPFNQISNFQKTKKDDFKEMNFLTEKEFNQFIAYEQNYLYKAFFTILFYTGIRKGECLALTRHDIDFVQNTISINKTYNTNYKIETLPKTTRSKRILLVSTLVLDSLKEVCNCNNDEILFKEKIKATTLREKCQRNLKKAGIKKRIRIHDFRHSFATLCINKNIPIHIISEYLGHKDIYTTLNIYSHLYPNSQKILIDILENKN